MENMNFDPAAMSAMIMKSYIHDTLPLENMIYVKGKVDSVRAEQKW